MFLYLLIGSAVAAYLGVLFMLNRVPWISVKSLGWFCLKHVEINAGNSHVYIHQIKVRFNLSKSRDSPYKLLNLEFHDATVSIEKATQTSTKAASIDEVAKNFRNKLSVSIPKKVYEWLIQNKIINQFSIDLFRLTVVHQVLSKKNSVYFEYIRLENHFDSDGSNKLIANIFNGVLHNESSEKTGGEIRLCRNVGISVSWDTVFACDNLDKNTILVNPQNFAMNLAIAQLTIPLNTLNLLFDKEESKTNTKSDSTKIKYLPYDDLNEFYQLFKQLEIRLSDLTVYDDNYKLLLSTFVIALDHSINPNISKDSKLSSSLTSLSLYHLESKFFELPSANLNLQLDPLKLPSMLYRMQNDSNSTFNDYPSPLNMTNTISFTNPNIDIYYDQLDLILSILSNKKAKNDTSQPSAFNPKAFLKSLLSMFELLSIKLIMGDSDLRIHLPIPGNHEFHRDSLKNLQVKCTLLAFIFKILAKETNKLLDPKDSSPSIANFRTFLKLSNLKIDAADNFLHISKFNMHCVYSLITEKLSIKSLIRYVKLKSVNELVFHIFRQLRNWKISHFNEACSNLDKQDNLSFDKNDGPQNIEYLEIFEALPDTLASVKVDITDIHADVICKDRLPNYSLYDEELNENVNLGDFKRGVAYKLEDISFIYKKSQEEIMANIKSVQCFTLSEYVTEYIPGFDQVADSNTLYDNEEDDFGDLSSLGSSNSKIEDKSDLKKIKKVMTIKDISVSNREKDKNKLIVTIPEVNGRFDIFLLWCTVYAKTLFSSAPSVEKKFSNEEASALGKSRTKVKIDLLVESVAIVTRLPNSVDCLLELDSVSVSNMMMFKSANFRYIRLYVIHPSTKLWSRLLTISNPNVAFGFNDAGELFVNVHSTTMKLTIPHQFLFYTIIDNIITFAKAVRQILFNFKNLSDGNNNFSRILPEAKSSLNIPNVNIKSGVIGLVMENDAFETELSYIIELGLVEQKNRLEKMKAFEKHSSTIRERIKKAPEDLTFVKLDNKILRHSNSTSSSTPKVNSPLRKEFNDSSDNNHSSTFKEKLFKHKKHRAPVKADEENDAQEDLLTEEEASKKIENKLDLLLKEMSSSWITKFKKFRSVKIASWNHRADRVWGEDIINPLVIDSFEIQDYSSGPELFGAVVHGLDLNITKAHLDDVHEFLFKYAKGQPKVDYSILIPLYVNLRAVSLYMFLRDYPLPLISFPRGLNPNEPTMTLSGNFVINEKLVTHKEEMRYIFVPFSPAAPTSDIDHDCFYSVFIPRTLTPVKVAMDMKWDIKTNRPCILSWSKSYQASLLATMSSFDNFTKPEIDDSPLGWWDKASLILHGKMVFNISNELYLHIKSSGSPYDMVGKAAGFVFCWKNNISLMINEGGKHDELIKLDSEDFLLAIPDYSLAEKGTWSSFYEELEADHAGPYSILNRFKKRVMKLASDERVRWKLGFLFERNKYNTTELSDSQKRINTFKPHYEVMVTNPAFDWHPDSFEDFRSDYLHLAISVTSTSSKGNCYNAAYLSPMTFHYFFYWWQFLTNYISLPIKQGPLFNNSKLDKSHIKMGPHLFTVKYQLNLEPLSISHMYMHSTAEEIDSSYRVAFTGLKGHFAKCIIDLHQRKELVRYVNEKLNINSCMYHLKLNEGEVAVDEADLRFINATFKEQSLRGNLASYLSGKPPSTSHILKSKPLMDHIESFADWRTNIDRLDESFSWFDPDDFIELEVREVLSPEPHVEITPFFFSPKITYFREFSLQEDGPYPFGHESAHDCFLGIGKPDEAQAKLLNERISNIRHTLNENREFLHKLEYSNDPEFKHDIEKLKLDIEIGEEKIDAVRKIWEGFSGRFYDEDSEENISKVESRPISVYSNETSIEQVRDISNMNSTVSEFHNRFIFHNLQLKWNNKLRDLLLEYMQKVSDRKTQVYFMSKKAVDLVESVIRDSDDYHHDKPKEEINESQDYVCSQDVIESFDETLGDIDSEEQDKENRYLFKLIHPQIQLVSEQDPDSCVLVTSRDLEVRIIGVNVKGMGNVISESTKVSSLIETRYGVLFKDTHVFVFKKDESTVMDPEIEYGIKYNNSDVNWPPWLECEVCYDSSWVKNQLVIEKNSLALILKKPNYLFSQNQSLDQGNEITVHLAKVVINATSLQYSAIYYVITDLLVHGKTARDELVNRLDKVIALSDTSDFYGLDVRVRELQESIRNCQNILLKLDFELMEFTDEDKSQISSLELEVERMRMELVILMRGLSLRSSKHSSEKHESRKWNILSDQIIWHFLDDDREPFIDFALAYSQFSRVDSYDGSNVNNISIKMIQGFNLQSNSIYPELLRPCLELKEAESSGTTSEKPILQFSWTLLEPVGGIQVLQHAKLQVDPLKVQLDYDTCKSLFGYLFPTGNEEEVEDAEDYVESGESGYADDDEGTTFHDILTKNPLRSILGKNKTSGDSAISEGSMDALSDPPSFRSDSLSGKFSFSEEASSGSERYSLPKRHTKSSKTLDNDEIKDDISVIMNRSSRYMSIVEIEIVPVNIAISFKAPKHLNILDVHNLNIAIPNLKYRNKMWSTEDILLKLRKDIIKVIINHSGKILGNKFKYKKRNMISEPLKQISNYASYMTIQDLQQEGRSRDASKLDSLDKHLHPRHRRTHHHHSLKRKPSTQSNNFNYGNYLSDVPSEDTPDISDEE